MLRRSNGFLICGFARRANDTERELIKTKMTVEYITLRELGYTGCSHPFREVFWKGPKYPTVGPYGALGDPRPQPLDKVNYDRTYERCSWCNALLEDGQWSPGTIDFPMILSEDRHPASLREGVAGFEDYLSRIIFREQSGGNK